MFDIGFSEIVVIAVVALIVIGPERLPKTARTLGHLFGRLQRYVNDVKADINREIELDELRKLRTQVETAASDLKSSVENAARDVESGVRTVESELNAAADNLPPPDPETARLVEPGPLPNEPGGELSDAAPAELPRQPSLPGFDKI
jgi:sec-independent protein translocase protein TatB